MIQYYVVVKQDKPIGVEVKEGEEKEEDDIDNHSKSKADIGIAQIEKKGHCDSSAGEEEKNFENDVRQNQVSLGLPHSLDHQGEKETKQTENEARNGYKYVGQIT